MIRLRACILALVALLLFPLASQAVSIRVTTPNDVVAADNLCSLREAYLTTVRASDINDREGSRKKLESQRTELQEAKLDIEADTLGLVSFSISKLSASIQVIEDELNAIDDLLEAEPLPATDARRTEIATLLADIVAYRHDDLETLPGNAGLAEVNEGITLHDRALKLVAKEYDRLQEFDRDDGCSNGTFFDTILLDDDTTYYLGEALEISFRITLKGGTGSVITRCRQASQCPDADPAVAARLLVLNSNAEISNLSLVGGGIGWGPLGTVASVIERSPIDLVGGVGPAPDFNPIPDGEPDNGEYGRGGAVLVNSAATFTNVTFRGNRAQDGGAIHVGSEATLTLEKVSFFGNEADNDGGAISVEGSGVSYTGGVIGRHKGSCRLLGRTFAEIDSAGGNDRNCARRHGGAIATNGGATGTPSVTLAMTSIVGNDAGQDGSALHATDDKATLTIENVTFAHNRAGGTATLYVSPTTDGTLIFNNVTMVENRANAGTGGIFVDVGIDVELYNSVVAGNQGPANPDCDFNGLTVGAPPPITLSSFRRNMYMPGSSCPGARYLTTSPSAPEQENFEVAPGQFLIGRLPADPDYNAATDGPVDDSLLVPDAGGEYYLPVYPDDLLDIAENRLVNRGAGPLDAAGCSANDQRSESRQSSVDPSCDIGAIEYQVGRRDDDVFETLVNERKCIDVSANDIGDATYVRYSLEVLAVERGRGTAVVASDDVDCSDAVCFQSANPGVPVVDIAQCPNAAEFYDTAAGVYRVHEVVMFTPTPGFHGEIEVTYALDWQTRPTAGSPQQDRLSGIATIRTDVATGITNESLKGGALFPALLALLGLLGARRGAARRLAFPVRKALLLAGLAFMPLAQAENIIYVNSGIDEPERPTPGDGKCTLREALTVALNDKGNPTGGDCLDGNEGPDVVEFLTSFANEAGQEAGHPVVRLKDQVRSYGGVTLRCPEPTEYLGKSLVIEPDPVFTDRARVVVGFLHTVKPGDRVVLEFGAQVSLDRDGGFSVVSTDASSFTVLTAPGPQPVADTVSVIPVPVCTVMRDPASTKRFRLLDSSGSLVIRRMILQGGRASTTGVSTDGGAIFSSGNLTIEDSVIRDNQAVNGGGVFLGGSESVGLTVQRSLFADNRSLDGQNAVPGPITVGTGRGGGGAIATTRDAPHKIRILASTFTGNRSYTGAAALDLNSRAAAVVANSTLVGNYSDFGSGALDVSGVSALSTVRNVTIVGNMSGAAPFLDGWESGLNPVPTPPLQRGAFRVGTSSVVLASSIISSNYVYDPLIHGDPYPAAGPDPLQFASTALANCERLLPASQGNNLFGDLPAPPAAHACVMDVGSTDTIVNAADVYDITGQRTETTGLNTDTLLTALIDSGLPLPEGWLPVLALNPARAPTVNAGWMLDSGYEDTSVNHDSLTDPASEGTLKCTSIDQRGVSRLSGGRCDRGAYELLQVSASDDEESNVGRDDRRVVVDLLANDFFDDISALPVNRFKSDCDTVEVSAIIGTKRYVRWKENTTGDLCIEIEDDIADGDDLNPGVDIASGGRGSAEFLTPSAAEFETSSPYVLRFDNKGIIRQEKLSGDPLAVESTGFFFGQIGLLYRIYTVGQVASAWANLSIGIDNVPPVAVKDAVFAAPGDAVSIDVLSNDSDADPQLGATLEITGVADGGCAVTRTEVIGTRQVPLEWQCQFGKLFFTPAANRFTFVPDNAFSPFSQTFSYEITDNDPVLPKSGKATVTINVVRPTANAGSLLGEKDLSNVLGIDWLGAPAPAFGLALLGGLLRRRRAAARKA